VIKLKRRRWTKHVFRVMAVRNVYRLLVCKYFIKSFNVEHTAVTEKSQQIYTRNQLLPCTGTCLFLNWSQNIWEPELRHSTIGRGDVKGKERASRLARCRCPFFPSRTSAGWPAVCVFVTVNEARRYSAANLCGVLFTSVSFKLSVFLFVLSVRIQEHSVRNALNALNSKQGRKHRKCRIWRAIWRYVDGNGPFISVRGSQMRVQHCYRPAFVTWWLWWSCDGDWWCNTSLSRKVLLHPSCLFLFTLEWFIKPFTPYQ
jgi:hypothetical protein